MTSGLPSLLLFAVAVGMLSSFLGCGGTGGRATEPGDVLAPARTNAPVRPEGAIRSGSRTGHEWFPLVPGRTSDFRITKAGVGVRYLRATLGAPERFFGRSAYPWVFSPVPGQVPDTSLVGLRQYFALGDDGALQFVGAQNNGFMSHTEPPLRLLLADPEPLAAWADTVRFESFLPGGELFFEATQVQSWRSSARTHLKLAAGSFQALRSRATIEQIDLAPAPGPLRSATHPAPATRAAFATRGVASRPGELEIVRGFWFARRHGIVARDYPAGFGPIGANTNSYELIDEGTGPIPSPVPVTP